MSRLFLRLFGWFCAANLVTLLLTALITERVTTAMEHGRQPDWPVIAEATLMRQQLGGRQGLERWQERLHRRGLEVFLLDAERRPLAGVLPEPLRDQLDELLAGEQTVLRRGRSIWLAGVQLSTDDGQRRYFVAQRQLHPPAGAPFPIGLQLSVAVLMVAAVGAWLTRSLTRPIAAIQRGARAVAEGQLDARVGPPHTDARDELGALARDFDSMAGRIQALVEHTRGLLHDVSHELRSPLARLQLALELAKRGREPQPGEPLERAQREVQRLDRVIGEVLALARLETGMPDSGFEALRLDTLVEDRLDDHADRIAERGLSVERQLAAARVHGDRLLLGRALDNLLDNAIKFSPPGGQLQLRLRSSAGQLQLELSDQGPGVDPDDAARLLRPFYRGANAPLAGGQGMGLAIVDRIARLHGGSVALRRASAQGGTVACLTLPETAQTDL